MANEGLQPELYGALICVRAPLMAVSGQDGQIRLGAHGYFLGDHRSLSRLVLTIDGAEPTMLTSEVREATRARFFGFHSAATSPPDHDAAEDPHFEVVRELEDGKIREHIKIRNIGHVPRRLDVVVEIGCDYAGIDEVKAGGKGLTGTVHEVRPGVLGWRRYRVAFDQESRRAPGTTVSTEPRPDEIALGSIRDEPPTIGRFVWHVDLTPGTEWRAALNITQPEPPRPFPFVRPEHRASWAVRAPAPVPRPIDRLLANSLADLEALRLVAGDRSVPLRTGLAQEAFIAAGAPWYLTLFGRDSLWAARMLLPIDHGLALGTLAMLSRYQGAKDDRDNEERPGKIPHELRAGPTFHGGTMSLPPVYYGSIDATLLFIILLAETWRHGGDEDAIRALLPSLHSALNWLDRQVSEHNGGFVAYVPQPGQLSNQGWKDSPDAVSFGSGRYAQPPISLCEVQAYAYEAALGAAEMLERLESRTAEADRWRDWAAALKQRFRKVFWLEDAHGRYPGIALDRDLVPVDGPSSNIGHLLSGGILDQDEAAEVTRILLSPAMNSGWGIRTRSAKLTSYSPFGYHRGSVWPHDTAIAIRGLANHDPDAAAALASDLLDASASFGYRLPELYSGIGKDESSQPVPVRAACLPQAWSSATAVVIAQALGALH